MHKKSLCLINIGDELLNGRTLNTNARDISDIALKHGISTDYHITIGDDRDIIIDTLRAYMSKSDIIIISGGLGPTPDDITVGAVAEAMYMKTVVDKMIYNMYQDQWSDRDESLLIKQSTVIEGALLVENTEGMAFGQIIKQGNTTVILIPGVPAEALIIAEKVLIPITMKKKENTQTTFRLYDITESEIITKLRKILTDKQLHHMAFLPNNEFIDVIFKNTNLNVFNDRIIESAMKAFRDNTIPSYENEKLISIVHNLLSEKGLSISVAESCTGGLLGKVLTDSSGSSNYFKGGIIAYSDEVKIKNLNISRSKIDKFGAVSREIADAMAHAVRNLMQTDIGIGITGIAGPNGGSREKPIGTVFYSVEIRERIISKQLILSGSRNNIRETSVYRAIFTMIRELLNE